MVFSFLGGRRDGGETPAARPRGPAEVRAYWEGLRQDGAIPTRADLDPRGMANVLDQVFVAERIGTGLVRLRIAGTGLTEIAGLDMKGLPLSALFLPEARLRLAAVLERVFTPARSGRASSGRRAHDRPPCPGRAVVAVAAALEQRHARSDPGLSGGSGRDRPRTTPF
ncbi:MAG: PAS domain-containing protein [Rhodobacter sp.]|nr:PAS domain-containing protein [Rhodobacter sp.]